MLNNPQFGEHSLSLRSSLLSPEELAQNLGLSPATLADWRSQGRGPAYLKAGRRIWYPKVHVERWIQSQIHETTNVTEKSQRDLALPLQTERQGIQRNNRLGRHKTKHEGRHKTRSRNTACSCGRAEGRHDRS